MATERTKRTRIRLAEAAGRLTQPPRGRGQLSKLRRHVPPGSGQFAYGQYTKNPSRRNPSDWDAEAANRQRRIPLMFHYRYLAAELSQIVLICCNCGILPGNAMFCRDSSQSGQPGYLAPETPTIAVQVLHLVDERQLTSEGVLNDVGIITLP